MSEFIDKVAIVTGGAQGIGRATANRLAQEGAHVVVADIQVEKGRQVVDEIETAGGSARFILCDVGKHDQIRAAVDETMATWNRLDYVVNNAYWSIHANVEELAEEDWDKGMNVMLKAIYLFGKHAFPQMKAGGGGAMVNIASVHGYAAYRRYPVYDAAKAGVINLTRQMAVDYGPFNIRVNGVSPGWIITETTNAPEEVLAAAKKIYPVRRTGVPDDIAKVVRFLLSDEAGFVTGHTLVADGGLTAQLQDDVAQMARS